MRAQKPESAKPLKVVAIASAGGHWVQLQRLLPAFQDQDVALITTAAETVPGRRVHVVRDANRNQKVAFIQMVAQIFAVLVRERPGIVVSTGAAPGYVALRLGRLFGAKTVWIDSFANAEELSLSGRLAGRHADLWLTQWQHLARPDGPEFAGAVL